MNIGKIALMGTFLIVAVCIVIFFTSITPNRVSGEGRPCTVIGATPDMICTKIKNGCECTLPWEGVMKQLRQRACQYKAAGHELEPSVEKDLAEHPEVCSEGGSSGTWTSAQCLSALANPDKNGCPDACSTNGPFCLNQESKSSGQYKRPVVQKSKLRDDKNYFVTGDMKIKKTNITAYKVQSYADNPVHGPTKYMVEGFWYGKWYPLYFAKDKQDAVDWLEKNT